MKSLLKILLGIMLQIARILVLMAFTLNVRYYNTYTDNQGRNLTFKCIFLEETNALVHTLDSKWLILPDIINAMSMVTSAVGGAEFICAQTPYSMRGLMFGTVYGGFSVYASIAYGVAFPFTREPNIWGTGIISCGFWFLMLNLVALVINIVSLSILGIFYKKRKREDVLPNEQIFAERVYSKQL